jgi:hypothetical protein
MSPTEIIETNELSIEGEKKLYDQVIIEMFRRVYKPDADVLPFTKDELVQVCQELAIVINNVPDVPYHYRTGRSDLPDEILNTGNWVIEGAGKGKYTFVKLKRSPYIHIPDDLYVTEIPEATPDIVLKYGGVDEQAILTRIRYNRLVDTFLSLTAYHLQGHVRSSVQDIGQVEIDDLYVGVDTDGRWHVIPIEAKSVGPKERLGVIQVRQMILFAKQNYSDLILRPAGIKPLDDGSYVFLEFDDEEELEMISVKRYARYKLVRDDKRSESETR